MKPFVKRWGLFYFCIALGIFCFFTGSTAHDTHPVWYFISIPIFILSIAGAVFALQWVDCS